MRSRRGGLGLFTVFGLTLLSFAADQPPATTGIWSLVPTPFRPVNVTASGGSIWVCGADEMILTSKDGGATWETKHQNRDGEVLTYISFVDEMVGHAAGTGGLVLSTTDGGRTWKAYHAPATVRSFSFADAVNGIVVVGAHRRSGGSFEQESPLDGRVEITHDGGEHWEAIGLDSADLRPFTEVLSIAALDSSHFVMLRRQPTIEDAFVITNDGGKSWKVIHPQNDAANRALPSVVLVHEGEYWAFGMELVQREKGGGYGVPLALHSKDGETWKHGVAGSKEFNSCNSQGCYLWDGAVEVLYGEHEQYWSLPQDGSLGKKWAIAGNAGCTVSDTLKCGRATTKDKPPERGEAPDGIISLNAHNDSFADRCLECRVDGIVPDNPGPPSMHQVHASVMVRRDGTVGSVAVDYPPSKRISDAIAGQLAKWLFEPAHKGTSTIEEKKDVSLVLMCSGFPGRPETNRCTLYRSDEFSGARTPSKTASTTVEQ